MEKRILTIKCPKCRSNKSIIASETIEATTDFTFEERENYIKTYQLLLNSFIENSKKESVAKEFRPMFDQIAFQFAKLPIIDYAIEVLENEKYLGFNLGVKGDYIILANKYLDDDDDEVFFSVSYKGDPFIVNSMKVEDLVLTMQEVIQKSVLHSTEVKLNE